MTGVHVPRRSIPTYELYGELLSGSYSDPVHHETIRERSSQHDWTIRLHRHSQLSQVFLFRTPGVMLRLNEVEHISKEPLLLVVPAGCAHGFRFSEDVIGDVLSLPRDHLDEETIDRLAQFSQGAGAVLTRSMSAHFDEVDTLMRQLQRVYHSILPERHALLRTLTQLIVTFLSADMKQQSALASTQEAPHLTRQEMQAQAFCDSVEANFHSSNGVAEYARDVGVSPPHLTRVCKLVLGAPPNELVRRRRILEAKRLLEFTRLSVSEIAHRSGFRDAAFFSRTFKNVVGVTPQDYRKTRD